MDITYEDWTAALDWMEDQDVEDPYMLTEGVLGPRPPEPEPTSWCCRSLRVTPYCPQGVWVGFPHIQHTTLTPDEADAMAEALRAHARFARKQEAHEKAETQNDIRVGEQILYYDELIGLVPATVMHIVGPDTIKIQYQDMHGASLTRWVSPKTLEKI
jgi:hypothetical protein